MTGRCRRCGAAIEWATTLLGKAMPLDPAPPADLDRANVAAWIDGNGTLRARVLSKGERPARYERLTVAHFATCPSWGQLHRQRQRADS